MPSSYNNNLRLEIIATGEQSGTWGETTNNNLGTLIVDAITGKTSITSSSSPYTLTALNGAADESRAAALELNCTGANFIVIVPTVTKLYVVKNVNATDSVQVKTASGTGITVPPLKTVLLRCDGTNVVEQLDYVVGNFGIGGAFNVGDLSVANNLSVLGSAFLGSAQTATINVATPAVVTVSTAFVSGTAVVFSTTGTLPTGLTVGTTYYVSNINATTFNVSASPTLSPLVATSGAGSGTHTATTVSLTTTPPTASNNTQLATTAFVKQFINTTNWGVSETTATQTATITIATPAVVTVGTAPANGTAVSFSTTGALPTGITANAAYYVANRTSTTYNLATGLDFVQTVVLQIASPGVVEVGVESPQNGEQVVFNTTGTLPTGITAGTSYYVVNRTALTFEVALTPGGSSITFTGSYTGTVTVNSRAVVTTSGTQSGTQTETTSALYFKYKSLDRMSLDLGGNLKTSGIITSNGTV
jgi:hypothetical protein